MFTGAHDNRVYSKAVNTKEYIFRGTVSSCSRRACFLQSHSDKFSFVFLFWNSSIPQASIFTVARIILGWGKHGFIFWGNLCFQFHKEISSDFVVQQTREQVKWCIVIQFQIKKISHFLLENASVIEYVVYKVQFKNEGFSAWCIFLGIGVCL